MGGGGQGAEDKEGAATPLTPPLTPPSDGDGGEARREEGGDEGGEGKGKGKGKGEGEGEGKHRRNKGEGKHRRSERKWTKVKREIRPELRDQRAWTRNRFQATFQPLDALDSMERVHCADVSVAEFVARWERPCKPVVIDGLVSEPVAALWQPARLLHDFSKVKLKCGDDDFGNPVRLKLRHYRRYLQSEAKLDDSPLYIFDSAYGERAPEMLQNYQIPPYFTEDLFRLVGGRRPPHRWVIVGPRYSGSGIHIDPLGTSAWNMLMSGHKRWVLFAPEVSAELVKPPRGMGREAVTWFAKMLPRLRQQGVPCIDFIQRPGETIFVPSGWWHVILNLDLTIAVTQNFASSANFAEVWRATAKSRPRLASHWLAALEAAGYSELAAHAHGLLQRWEPEAFARLPPLPPEAAATGAGAGVAATKHRREAYRELLLDARWRRRRNRERRRREQGWFWCWCLPRPRADPQGMGDNDDDESTSSSDSSSTEDESAEGLKSREGLGSEGSCGTGGEKYESIPEVVAI